MELKDRIAAALATIPGARVLRVRPVRDRWLASVVSPAFNDLPHLDRQKMIDAALTGPQSQLTAEEYRSIALVVPYSPREFRGLLTERRADRARKQKPAGPTP